jgi:predicted transcriptional regulator YdeE
VLFKGISRVFSLKNEAQYDTIGKFWDDMSDLYGLESLVGLGYRWDSGNIYYAIGLKTGEIENADFALELPDEGWVTVEGLTDDLKEIYDGIYKDGALTLELESFTNDGRCEIRYRR